MSRVMIHPATYENVGEAVDRARKGEGPSLIEGKTMRMRKHAEHFVETKRPPGELEEWKKKDPLDRFTAKLLQDKILTVREIEEKKVRFMKEIDEAVQFAKDAPYPDPKEVTSDVFYEG